MAQRDGAVSDRLLASRPPKFQPPPPRLPVDLRDSPRAISTEAAQDTPPGTTERRYVSFCKRAALGQPTRWNRLGLVAEGFGRAQTRCVVRRPDRGQQADQNRED